MDPEHLIKHYHGRRRLESILHDADKHASLVCCVIMGLKSLAPQGSNPKSVVEMQHEYEVQSKKLKLEHSAKSRFQEAKIDTLKDENTKLKAKLLALQKSSASASARPGSILLSIKSARPPSNDILTSSGIARLGLFTPTKPASSAVDDPFTLSARVRNIFGSSSRRPLLDDASLISSTPFKRISEAGFSDNSNTDTHSPTSETLLKRSFSGASTANGGEESTDDERFASADNSMAVDTSTASIDTTKRRKKLQLRQASRVTLPLHTQPGRNLGLDDEDVNTLNYYQDDNFQAEGPDTATHTAPPLTNGGRTEPKKKKSFSIE